MILEAMSCLVVVVLYGGFTAFKKENRQELLRQISEEVKQEQANLLIEKIKAEQALLPTPILNENPKVERPPIWNGSSGHVYPDKSYNLNKRYEYDDTLEIIFEYLKAHAGQELLYSEQRFEIKYNPTLKLVSLYEINSRTREISQSVSLTIRQSFSERFYRKFDKQFELRMYGILSHKESLLKDFKKHFTLAPPYPYPKNMERRDSSRNVPISEYHSFILKVKNHYTENNITRRYYTIKSVNTFLEYCYIVGITYDHLDKHTLLNLLSKLETGSIFLDNYSQKIF